MNKHAVFLFLRLFCFCEHASHGEMMGVLGERYAPKVVAKTSQRARVGAYLVKCAGAICSFIKKVLF